MDLARVLLVLALLLLKDELKPETITVITLVNPSNTFTGTKHAP